MRKILFLFCLLLGGQVQVFGQTSYTITGTGNMPDYGFNSPWYSRSPNIKTAIIEDGVTGIGNQAFRLCRFTSIVIPSGVTRIGNHAFEFCFNFASVTIPEGVTNIGIYAFSGCCSLVSIDVSDENINYASEDGVLFNKDKTTLICFPAGKTGSYDIIYTNQETCNHIDNLEQTKCCLR